MSLSPLTMSAGVITACGIYNCVNAKDSKERRNAMFTTGLGIAIVAMEYYFSVGAQTVNYCPHMGGSLIFEHHNCVDMSETADTCEVALKKLAPILTGEEEYKVNNFIKLVNSTTGISCENYLPWKGKFLLSGTGYIGKMKPADLKKPVMWGIDSWQRVYFAIKHTCNGSVERVVTIFQRYTDDYTLLASGGQRCGLDYSDTFYEEITTLIKTGVVNTGMNLTISSS